MFGKKGSTLSELSFVCGDINNDGTVNQIDIRLLIEYIVFGRLDANISDVPQSPEILIESGAIGNNDYYTTLPVIKIIPRQKTNISKTTYKIEGEVQVQETDLGDNGIVNITKDGTYKITSYTYSKQGIRSEGTIKTIKIDCTAPIAPTFNIQQDPTENGWYSYNEVSVEINIGGDRESGPEKIRYEVTGETEIEMTEGREKAEVKITKEGTSNIKAYTIDRAGNVSKEANLTINKDFVAPTKPVVSIRSNNKRKNTSKCNFIR